MLAAVTEELLRRGHSEADAKKVLGEHFLDFFARVERSRTALAKDPPGTSIYTAN